MLKLVIRVNKKGLQFKLIATVAALTALGVSLAAVIAKLADLF